MQRCTHVFYSGRVQGVGFRYTVVGIAQNLDISGWVKNLFDGRVEARLEAEEEVLRDFLSQIENHFGDYITNTDVVWGEATGEHKGFTIRF